VDVGLLIKRRLEELHIEQRDLAVAAEVTESYISQLLTRKKLPPAPGRTDIYDKIGSFLKLPAGKLAKLAEHQRIEELKKNLAPPAPLFKDVRELIVQKSRPSKQKQLRAIFEKEPFGELERLVTQKLLDVVKRVARDELDSETWLRSVARISGRSYESMRVSILEFLDADAFDLSPENCVSFLDPLIESWDIDLATFGLEVVLNRRLNPGTSRKIEFVEQDVPQPAEEAGFKEFLRHQAVSCNITDEEIAFLRSLRFKGKNPTPLYYYRELQNLRDPLHFAASASHTVQKKTLGVSQPAGSVGTMHTYLEAKGVEKQLQLDARKQAILRWEGKRGRHGKKRAAKA
jgi:transcriptional regulator with XRE-family HTH domain